MTARLEALARAGFNVINLDPAEIELDLMTDVPHRPPVVEVAQAGAQAAMGPVPDPDLETIARRLYGDAHCVFATKGRAAEHALASVFAKPEGTVLTHGLFHSTEQAFVRAGMRVEMSPLAPAGSADVDLAWLEKRLGEGNIAAVCLEPCNGALAGWALSLGNVEAVSGLCRKSGVPLLIDATRIFANGAALGQSPRELAAKLLSFADGFTVSCAKELLVPFGAIVAVREKAHKGKLWAHLFERGTALEPLEARVQLASGMNHVLAHPELFPERRRQVLLLGSLLREAKVPFLEPLGGHAVFVDVTELAQGGRARALEGVLFEQSGIRVMITPNGRFGKTLMRLPVMVASRTDQELARIADAVRQLFATAATAPVLKPVPGEYLHPLMGRFERA